MKWKIKKHKKERKHGRRKELKEIVKMWEKRT